MLFFGNDLEVYFDRFSERERLVLSMILKFASTGFQIKSGFHRRTACMQEKPKKRERVMDLNYFLVRSELE